MSERIRPEQILGAMDKSRLFEQAWRVYSNPSDYSDEELQETNKLILDNWDNYETVISCPPDPDTWPPEVYDKIFAGLFHTNIRYPQNLKERTFREN